MCVIATELQNTMDDYTTAKYSEEVKRVLQTSQSLWVQITKKWHDIRSDDVMMM